MKDFVFVWWGEDSASAIFLCWSGSDSRWHVAHATSDGGERIGKEPAPCHFEPIGAYERFADAWITATEIDGTDNDEPDIYEAVDVWITIQQNQSPFSLN